MKNLILVLGLAMLLAGCDENGGRASVSLCGEWKFTKDPSTKLDASAADSDSSTG